LVRDLALLAIRSDHPAVLELIKKACTEHGFIVPRYPTLFEPAARHLGDLLHDDQYSELDVTLGLCCLQTAIRTLSAGVPPQCPADYSAPVVLVVPEPGEPHSFTAFLDSEFLWNAGWAPQVEYPGSDQELQIMLSTSWFDVLDLSLSTALRRGHWLSRMSRTVALARRASRNPNLVVVVSGRAFAECEDAHQTVGADAGVTGALQLKQVITRSLKGGHDSKVLTSPICDPQQFSYLAKPVGKGPMIQDARSWVGASKVASEQAEA
jgi:hypothetical protein